MKALKIILLLLLTGCSSDYRTDNLPNLIDARTFTVLTPESWVLIEDQGIDTYVGRIAGSEDTIYFDQGFLSFGSLDRIVEDDRTIYSQQLEIGGFPAILHKEQSHDTRYKTRLSVYIDAGDGQRLNRLYVFDPRNEKLVTRIFLTHQFK